MDGKISNAKGAKEKTQRNCFFALFASATLRPLRLILSF
jgi:hypothetical protein